MTISAKIREGRGPFWGGVKRVARTILTAHVPVNGATRPVCRGLYAVHVFVRESWIATRRFWWNEPLFRGQCESVGDGFRMEEIPYLTGRGRIHIGDNVRLSGKSDIGFTNRLTAAPELHIGDGTFIGHGCGMAIALSVRIGKHSLLAGGVTIRDYDGHPLDADSRRDGAFVDADLVRPIVIGDDVWLGAGARVLKGVTIGDRSVVAAGSTVVKDVPPDVVVAGSPAMIVKRLGPTDEESTGA